MNKVLSTFIACVLLSTGLYSQQFATIGAGTINSANYGPLYRPAATSTINFSNYVYLFTFNELISVGIPTGAKIVAIAWDKSNTASMTGNNLFQIRIQNTSQATVPWSANTYNFEMVNATTVYNSTTYTLPSATGWQIHTFDAPFEYTGGNLKIGTNFQFSGTASGAVNFRSTFANNMAAGVTGTTNTQSTIFSSSFSNYRANIRIYYTAYANDISVAEINAEYPIVPLSQGQVNVEVKVEHLGLSVSTNAISWAVIGAGNPQSRAIGSMGPKTDTTVNYTAILSSIGTIPITAYATIAEPDQDPSNDTLHSQIYVSDTIMAREADSVFAGGLGFSGGAMGEFGHVFDINTPDTLTTVSFRLDNPQQGTQVRVKVYQFNAGMTPMIGNLIDSTRTIMVGANGGGWYNLMVGCGKTPIAPGQIFVAIEQSNPINMSLSYTLNYGSWENTRFFKATTATWTDFTTLTTNLKDANMAIRINFGDTKGDDVLGLPVQTLCFNSTKTIKTVKKYQSYLWNDASFLDSIVVSSPGTYSITVTDAFGCVFTDQVSLAQLPDYTINSTVNGTSVCGGSNGSALANATGPYPPYTYKWSNGQSAQLITGLSGGNYTVSVTDAQGCVKTRSVLVPGSFPQVSGTVKSPVCNGQANGSVTTQTISGTPPYTYQWSNSATTATVNNVGAGPLVLILTDSHGCRDTQLFSIPNPPIFNLSTANSQNPSSCGMSNGVARVDPSGGVAPYTYFWANGQVTNALIGLGEGTYSVTVTDANGCVKADSVSITDPASPTISTSGSTINCAKATAGTASVAISGGTPPYTILWNTGATSQNISNLVKGVYTVNVIDANNCFRFGTAEVIAPNPMNFTLVETYFTSSVCQDQVTVNQLTGGVSPYTFKWNDPAGQTSATATNLCNGFYKVVITDANSCRDSASIVLFNPSTSIDVAKSLKSEISVFPNPASTNLNVQLPLSNSKVEMMMFDAIGNLVQTYTAKNTSNQNVTINISDLSNGIYFLKITSEEFTETRKFQVVK